MNNCLYSALITRVHTTPNFLPRNLAAVRRRNPSRISGARPASSQRSADASFGRHSRKKSDVVGPVTRQTRHLVDLLDGGAAAVAAGRGTAGHAAGHAAGHTARHTRHAARHTAGRAAARLVEVGDDRRAHLLQLLLVVLKLVLLRQLRHETKRVNEARKRNTSGKYANEVRQQNTSGKHAKEVRQRNTLTKRFN